MSIYPVAQCQHTKIDGTRCGSPARREKKYCHFHERCFPVEVDVSTSAAVPRAPFFLPALEDPSSIQLAITQVCEHLLHNRLDPKKAGVLLYAMQVASSNLGRLDDKKSEGKRQENSPGNGPEVPSPVPALSEATSQAMSEATPAAILKGPDDSGSTSSGEPENALSLL